MADCDPWPYDTTCVPADWPSTGNLAGDLDQMTPGQRSAYDAASQILAGLAVTPLGTCVFVVRPCAAACAVGAGYSLTGAGGWYRPFLYDGEVYNSCGCASGARCGCVDPRYAIHLGGPIAEVVQVLIDGVVVDPDAYTVVGRRLTRVDGGTWPMWQPLNLPATEVGTFQITYRQGVPLPVAGQRALTALMIEMYKAACDDASCRLPARVTNVVREGVSYTLMDDPSKILDAGRTGIAEVDMWLNTINPYGTRTRMRVYSPDTSRAR